jgi:mRNA interferase RelE/StbE
MDVVITASALKDIAALPASIQARILAAIHGLADWPNVRQVKALKGKLKGAFRLRVGDYRVIFYVEGRRIVVTDVAQRGGIYE